MSNRKPTCEAIEDLKPVFRCAIRLTKRTGKEVGGYICADEKGNLSSGPISVGEPREIERETFEQSTCTVPGTFRIGDWHTHPKGGIAWPSPGDMLSPWGSVNCVVNTRGGVGCFDLTDEKMAPLWAKMRDLNFREIYGQEDLGMKRVDVLHDMINVGCKTEVEV